MLKVVSDFAIGAYRVLALDGEKPNTKYTKYVIEGKEYKIIPAYDIGNCIAIKSTSSFVGKTVEFR